MKPLLPALIFTLVIIHNFCDAQVIRKNYREMTSTEKQIFTDAIYALGPRTTTGTTINNFATNHQQLFLTSIHRNNDFLAWHRWFILYFEKALQSTSVAGADKIALPYWDWISTYYTTTPTDAVISAPLWDASFLGQFNMAAGWNLDRNLGNAGPIGTTSTLTNALHNALLTTDFNTFRDRLESNLHDNPHIWVAGIMAGGGSPGDPVFYLHHNMVDKIWQDWTNLGRTSTYTEQNMPNNLPTGTTNFPVGVPYTNPSTIVDSRASAVKVWFAENGKVVLDKYTVSGQEKYAYTGVIEAGRRVITSVNLSGTVLNYSTNDFIIPSGANCLFLSGGMQMGSASEPGSIRLVPGFRAHSGCTFTARINSEYFNNPTSGARSSQTLSQKADETGESMNSENVEHVTVTPNPATNFARVTIHQELREEHTYSIVNSFGINIIEGSSKENVIDISLLNVSRGVYFLIVKSGSGNKHIKRLLVN